MRRMSLAVVAWAVCAVTAVACGDSLGPDDKPPGSYGLSTVNGKTLTMTLYSDTGFKIEILSGSVDLTDNGKFFKRYRVGTGQFSKTPVGEFKITTKLQDPPWYRPDGTTPRHMPRASPAVPPPPRCRNRKTYP